MPSPPDKIEIFIKSLNNKKDRKLCRAIYESVTEQDQKKTNDIAIKCKQLFKQGADPSVLTKLEKSLRKRKDEAAKALAEYSELLEQKAEALATLEKSVEESTEHYNNYINKFLRVLQIKIMASSKLFKLSVFNKEAEQPQGSKTRGGEIVGIISDIVKQSDEKEYEHYIQFLTTLLEGITRQKKTYTEEEKTKAQEIGRIISEIISERSNKNHSSSATQQNNTLKTPIVGPIYEEKKIRKSQTSPNPIEQSPLSHSSSQSNLSIDSEWSSVNETFEEIGTTLNGIGAQGNIQETSSVTKESGHKEQISEKELDELNKIVTECEEFLKRENSELTPTKSEEKTKLEHPTKTRPKVPSGRRLPSKWIKGRVQPKQPAKGEQNMQENENSEPTKQPNNRNFRIALATGCALSAIVCLIAGVVTLGMVGAGLLVMSVVLAMAAVVTRYLTLPSSELTSTDLSPLIVDDGKRR
ncbi:MAG: hypothetical protein LBU56_00155 [Rickettsiales bacterium]|jgi:hypothetical protein|nr:hypothetical protein [Rickettsiales bacterium]